MFLLPSFQVFNILRKTPLGVRLCDQLLPQHPTISEMSSGELNFALTVQSLLNHIQHPEYRQIVVEVSFVLLLAYYPMALFSLSSLCV